MGWAVITGSADQVAIVGNFAKTCPYFLTVDYPFIAIKLSKRFQRCKVATCVWFAHSNAPCGSTGEHVGQKRVLLLFGSICNERWSHLSIGKPRSRNWSTCCNHFFSNDQSLDSRATTTAKFGWPGHADPTVASKFLGKLFGVAVHPRVVEPSVTGNCIKGNGSRLGAKRNVLW